MGLLDELRQAKTSSPSLPSRKPPGLLTELRQAAPRGLQARSPLDLDQAFPNVQLKSKPQSYQSPTVKVKVGDVMGEVPRAAWDTAIKPILTPFLRPVANVVNIGKGIGAIVQKRPGPSLNQPIKVPGFGNIKPVTGPVEAAGVGTDIGLTLSAGNVTKALKQVGFLNKPLGQVGRKGVEKIPAFTKQAVQSTGRERPERAIDVFRSVESRMQRSSPQGKRIASLFQESDTRSLPRVGQRTIQLTDAKLNKVKNPTAITDALEGRIKPDTLTQKQRGVFNVIDDIRQSVSQRSQKAGLQIRTSGGGMTPFKPRENYYPHYIPEVNQLSKGKIRSDVIKAAVNRKDFKSVAEATDALDKYVQFVKSGGKDHLDFFANRLIQQESSKIKPSMPAPDLDKYISPNLKPGFNFSQPGKVLNREAIKSTVTDVKTQLSQIPESMRPQVTKAIDDVAKGKYASLSELSDALNNALPASLDETSRSLLVRQSFQKAMILTDPDMAKIYGPKLFENAPKLSLAEARGRVLRYFRASRQQRYGNLERAREVDLPFYDPNPARVIPKYIASAERRLADAEVLGPNLERVDQLLGTVKHPDVQKTLRYLVKVARRGTESGETLASKALDVGRGASTFRLSPLSGITNLGQSTNSFLASDAKSFTKGFAKAIFTKEGRRLPIESGNLAESVLRTIQQQAGGDSRIAGGYLKAIGFTGTERFNRRIASNVGAEYAKSLYKQLVKNPTNKIARQELLALEMSPDDLLKTGFNKDVLLRAAKVFTDKTQFRSREIDLPALSSTTALGKNISQFKTFAFQQSRFVAKQTVGQLKTNPRRALRNIAILATVYPLTGEAIADLRAMVQGKERTTSGIQRYIENAAQVGAFGILYDAVKSTSFEGGLAKFIAGPTISGIIDNIENTKQSLQDGWSDSEKRDYIRQIPGVGPIVANRMLPAEQKEKNKNLRSETEEIKSDQTFGETKVPLARFEVDGKQVSLNKESSKEFHADMVKAYIESIKEAKDKTGDQKKNFTSIWNKKKSAVKKSWLESGKVNPNTIYGPKHDPIPESTFTTISKYGRGIVQDPEGTLKALFTAERLKEVTRGVAVMDRQKFLSILDKGDKNTEVDHTTPLWLGGSNDPSNFKVLTKEKHDSKTKFEADLRRRLERKEITVSEARKLHGEWLQSVSF